MSIASKPPETRALALVDDYLEAYKACRETLYYCEKKGSEIADPVLLRELHDAGEICLASANFLMRGSRHHRALLRLSSEVLQACADAIDRSNVDDDQLQVAYVACLRAQQGYRDMTEHERTPDQSRQDQASEESFPASDPATHTPKS